MADGAPIACRTGGTGRAIANAFLKARLSACRYYLEVMVPEALSLKGSAMAGSELLYALDAEGMAAIIL